MQIDSIDHGMPQRVVFDFMCQNHRHMPIVLAHKIKHRPLDHFTNNERFCFVLLCTCASGVNGGGVRIPHREFVTRRGSRRGSRRGPPPSQTVVAARLRGLSCTLPHKPAAAQAGHRVSSRSFLKFAPSHLF